jgi:hypothetical protein
LDFLKKNFSKYKGIKFVGDEYVEIDFKKLIDSPQEFPAEGGYPLWAREPINQRFLTKMQNAFYNYLVSFYDLKGEYHKGNLMYILFVHRNINNGFIRNLEIDIVRTRNNEIIERDACLVDMKKPVIFYIEETQVINNAEKYNL